MDETSGGVTRILLAENNRLNRMMSERILTGEGYAVDCVENGVDAVNKAVSTKYDIVMISCRLPDKDGFTAASEIREYYRNGACRLPIIAFTGSAPGDFFDKGAKAGISDFVADPVVPDKLIKMVKKHLVANEVARQVSLASGDGIPPLSVDILLSVCNNKVDAVRAMIQEFVSVTGADIQKARESLDATDIPALKSWAHRVKGSSAMIGADPVRQAAAELERLAISMEVEAALRQLCELENEFKALVSFSERVIDLLSKQDTGM